MRFLVAALASGLMSFSAMPALSQPAAAASSAESTLAGAGDHWRLMASPYTFHYSRDPLHKPVVMLGLERQHADKSLWGGTLFSNSFGQASTFVYGGQRLTNWSAHPELYAQWSAGIIYGYHGAYKDKVPLNVGGFSPGLVLALGWQFTPAYSAQLNVLGNSALMFQVSLDLR